MNDKTWKILEYAGVRNIEAFDGMTAAEITESLRFFYFEVCVNEPRDYTMEDLKQAGKEIAKELEKLPDKAPLCWCGAPMIAAGVGKYPYPCKAQDKHPDAMVYIGCEAGHTSWTLKLETPKTRGTAPFKAVNFDNDSLTTTQQ